MTWRSLESSQKKYHQPVADLRSSCLSYAEVLAQSVSVIAPSTVPAAVIGLIFASAGNGTWLSFLLGTLGFILVAVNINIFASRSASPGSLYSYIRQGLGPVPGFVGGWALAFAYTLTGMSTLCGLVDVADHLIEQVIGVHPSAIVLFAVSATVAGWIAIQDIRLSAKSMLIFEGLSVFLILVLGVSIWARHGFAVDLDQFALKDTTTSGIFSGIVLVVFVFSGFESSTSLGAEAKDPLKTIPRSITHSVLLSGFFFVFLAYTVVLGFKGSTTSLANADAPLADLAGSLGWNGIGTLIMIGVLLSFFSCTLASINSTARIIFSMARHGLFFEALGEAHRTNKTPHIAVIVAAFITFATPSAVYLMGIRPFDAQGHFGTLCSFGFIVVYFLISIAGPIYLKARDQLSGTAIACAVGGVGFMVLPLIGIFGLPGSKTFPPITSTNALLISIFVGYMVVGIGWLLIERSGRRSSALSDVEGVIGDGVKEMASSPERGR
jgi:amino acid transporter